MGRPLYKMNTAKINFIINNSGKLSFKKMAKELKIHHTTILFYVKKLKKRGITVVSGYTHSPSEDLIDKIQKNEISN